MFTGCTDKGSTLTLPRECGPVKAAVSRAVLARFVWTYVHLTIASKLGAEPLLSAGRVADGVSVSGAKSKTGK